MGIIHNNGVRKDFKVFTLIYWNDRENCGRSEFCMLTQELQMENASVEISTKMERLWEMEVWRGRS